jgi:hypothetical protein
MGWSQPGYFFELGVVVPVDVQPATTATMKRTPSRLSIAKFLPASAQPITERVF